MATMTVLGKVGLEVLEKEDQSGDRSGDGDRLKLNR